MTRDEAAFRRRQRRRRTDPHNERESQLSTDPSEPLSQTARACDLEYMTTLKQPGVLPKTLSWYSRPMSTTYSAPMGDRGRMVVPAELRARQKWDQGDTLLFIETERGVILATRQQALTLMREQLSGPSLVDELIRERREAAAVEDAS